MTDSSKIPVSRLSDKSFDTAPQSGSSNMISSGAVFEALKDKLGKTDTAAKATADADGNIINKTYAKLSDIITFEYEDEL